METKKITLPSTLITTNEGIAYWNLNVPNMNEIDLRFHLCEEESVFYDVPEEGCLMFQEFWGKEMSKVYLDVNEEGELIAVFPEGMDGYLNEEGELIIVE